MKKKRRGQSTAEYAIVIGLVIAAVMAMQTYVKRSLQGGIKFAVDKVKKSDTAQGQYEPYYLESNYNVVTETYTDIEETQKGGKVIRTTGKGAPKETTRTGHQKIRDVSDAD